MQESIFAISVDSREKVFPDCGARTSYNNQLTIKSEFPATFSFPRDDFWHI